MLLSFRDNFDHFSPTHMLLSFSPDDSERVVRGSVNSMEMHDASSDSSVSRFS
jgi:hypothetical protein